jgi:excisionase family DNA binding protein
MQERILTPDQVAQILQIHPFTVLKFIKQGKLKASKLGRVYRIRESELESFLDQSSGKSVKSVDSPTNDLKKSKNKNKTSLNQLTEPSGEAESSQTKPDSENSPEVTVSRVEVIEPAGEPAKHGGDDEYYILQ